MPYLPYPMREKAQMFTTETTHCDRCGSAVTLHSDGRFALAAADPSQSIWPTDYSSGDTVHVEQDGIVLAVSCPAVDVEAGDTCSNYLTFPGEGTVEAEPAWFTLMVDSGLILPIEVPV